VEWPQIDKYREAYGRVFETAFRDEAKAVTVRTDDLQLVLEMAKHGYLYLVNINVFDYPAASDPKEPPHE